MLTPQPADAALMCSALAYTLVGVGAAVALSFSRHRRFDLPSATRGLRLARAPNLVRGGLYCGGAIAVPALLLLPARRQAGAAAVTALLALSPFAASFARAVRRSASVPATLGPGLIALAGALFLLSVGEPTTAAVGFGFALGAAAALLLGAFAVLAHAALVHWPPVHATLLASSSAGLLFWAGVLLSSGTHGRFAGVAHQVWSPTFALELAVAALGIFLLREIPATSYTTRYLWAPLIAAAESYVAVRPPLSWRIVAGGIMLATGGVLLLRQDRHVPDEVLGLNQILLGSTSEPRIDSEHGRFDVHRRGG